MSPRARRLAPYVAVATAGIGLAVLQYLLDDHDRLAWSLPILGVTAVVLLVMALARRGDTTTGELERVAEETGLSEGGVAPLPRVTAILAHVHEPVPILRGRLPGHGPRVRVAIAGDRLVSISETAATGLDTATEDWLVLHELRPRAGIEDGLLVVAVARGTGGRDLLDLALEIERRVAAAS
jgi:hypothetical protein